MDTCWGMFVPWTADLGIQDWEMEKEFWGYPEVFLFTMKSAKSSAGQCLFFLFFSGQSDPSFPQRHISHEGEELEISSVPFSPTSMGSEMSFAWV